MTTILVIASVGVLVFADVVLRRRNPDAADILVASIYAAFAVGNLVSGVHYLLTGQTLRAGLSAGMAGWMAYCAWEVWKNRKNRKRRGARVLAKVRDLGHRLVVAPVLAPAGAR
ncbi:hypothetical protein [Kineosporia sp. R_H_3]|uniref:hypothetical protein n=1 Tax=Kineosporia sp. R_H_3 TaxID=1961848 RepID=UPI000B4B454F|nr:hypothetical protein [Kineosporia sp. R_H_3]